MRSAGLFASASLLALGVLCVPAATPAPADTLPTYLVHDLGSAEFGEISDLNASNVACGSLEVEAPVDESLFHAALFIEGRQIDLGTLGGHESFANALNDQGQVVGEAQTASGAWHAFFWIDVNGDGAANPGEMQDLGAANGRASRAYHLNNHGKVVGEILFPRNRRRAFRWKAGKMSLPLVRGASQSSATWIGEDGTMLGNVYAGGRYLPARWKPGKIGEVIYFRGPRPLGLTVVGRSRGGDIWMNLHYLSIVRGPESFGYIKQKGKSRLTALEQPGDSAGIASVNLSGQAVGTASLTTTDDEGNETTNTWGVYWQGRKAHNLDDLLSPGSGLSMLDADAINEAGWIVGEAEDEEGEEHLVLLEPQHTP